MTDKIIKLTDEEKKALKQGAQIRAMIETEGWKEVFMPYFESKIRNAWVDPRTFKDDQEYAYAMKTAWAMAKASDEILEFVEKTISEGVAMSDKQKGKEDKLRESMS
jgi:hypothetical protein